MNPIKEHLKKFGIKKFRDEYSFTDWALTVISQKEGLKIEKLKEPLIDGTATFFDQLQFYNFISDKRIAGVVHSEKADAIRIIAESVKPYIFEKDSILDLGCHIGYLTSWYALSNLSSFVVGIDSALASIKTAQFYAKELGINNVHYEGADLKTLKLKQKFDVIVDSQSICYCENQEKIFHNLSRLINQSGTLITIPAIGTLEEITQFINRLESANWGIKIFEFIQHEDLGNRQAYPFIIANLNCDSIDIELDVKHENVFAWATSEG